MGERSIFRGHDMYMKDGRWVFSDIGAKVADTWESRPCGYCNEYNTPEGHDACLGVLPGVMNACCGHGQDEEAYVQILDGTVVTGSESLMLVDLLKRIK